MLIVEQEYRKQLAALSSRERIARCESLLQWTREILARQIVTEKGAMPTEQLKWEVALRQYGSDANCRKLIERKLRDVPE